MNTNPENPNAVPNPNPNAAPVPPPPLINQPPVAAAQPPAAPEAPDDLKPITSTAMAIEAILRQPRRVVNYLRQPQSASLSLALLLVAIVCSLLYGFVVGTFSGGTQYWAAPVKVAGGMLLSACICLPSLYIFTCVSGSPARLMEVVGLLAGMLALMTVLLVGFAPVAWVFSQSTESVAMMGVLHLAFWAVACWFAVSFLHAGFRQISGRPVSGIGVWVVLFALVLLQMTTALRPLIGTADTFLPAEKRFFVGHWFKCLEESAKQAREKSTAQPQE